MASKGLLSVCLEYKGLGYKGGAMPLDGYNACRYTLLTIETDSVHMHNIHTDSQCCQRRCACGGSSGVDRERTSPD